MLSRLVLIVAACSIAPCAIGQEQQGAFVGIVTEQVSISGDFNGSTFLSGAGSSEIVPRFSPSNGLGITAGFRSDRFELEVGYVRADMRSEWLGLPVSSQFRTFTGDVKWLFRAEKRLRPYVAFGLGIPSIEIDDGSTDGTSLGTATFTQSLSTRIGGGTAIRFNSRLAMDVEAMRRFNKYGHVNGLASGDLQDSLRAGGTMYAVGLKFFFGT